MVTNFFLFVVCRSPFPERRQIKQKKAEFSPQPLKVANGTIYHFFSTIPLKNVYKIAINLPFFCVCYCKNAASFVDVLYILIKMKWYENKNEHEHTNLVASMHVCVCNFVCTHTHEFIVHATLLIKHCTCDAIIFAQHADDTFACVQNHRCHFMFIFFLFFKKKTQ